LKSKSKKICCFDQVRFEPSPNSHVTIDTIHPIVCRTQSKCFEYATLQSACGFTNGHIEIN